MVSLYERFVVPRLIDCACGQREISQRRAAVVPLAQGRVLELGIGSGLNLPFYDRERVTALVAVEPSPELRRMAEARARRDGTLALEVLEQAAESLPFADASFDTVVCTFTMCSVTDQARVLAEMRRVLKPGGLLLYAEHGRAPDADVLRWQQRIEPTWKKVMGNCHLTRPVTGAIEQAGFTAMPMARQYMTPGPRWAGWMEWGSAVKAG